MKFAFLNKNAYKSMALVLALITVVALLYPVYFKADTSSLSDRTRNEIIEKYNSLYMDLSVSGSYYDEKPEIGDFTSLGKVKNDILVSGLNMINFVRYLYGVNDVSLDNSSDVQAIAVALAKVGVVSYEDNNLLSLLSDAQKTKLNNSSIGWFSNAKLNNPTLEFVKMYMNGLGINSAGHRQMILSRNASSVSLGLATRESRDESKREGTYGSLYMNVGASGAKKDYYSWPSSGYFPSEFINSNASWSVTITDSSALYSSIKSGDIKITVNGNEISQYDIYQNVDDDYYLVFNPASAQNSGADKFEVVIESKSGGNQIAYSVEYFSLYGSYPDDTKTVSEDNSDVTSAPNEDPTTENPENATNDEANNFTSEIYSTERSESDESNYATESETIEGIDDISYYISLEYSDV